MIADWTVEVSQLSPSIDVPWEGWVDLRGGTPGLWKEHAGCALAECQAYPELLAPLREVNSLRSFTSKLDVFRVQAEEADPEIAEAGELATRNGLGSYLDVLPVDMSRCASFEDFEAIARRVVKSLSVVRDQPRTAIEIVIRPARNHGKASFGWTLYAMGFGETEAAARAAWSRAYSLLCASFGGELCLFLDQAREARTSGTSVRPAGG